MRKRLVAMVAVAAFTGTVHAQAPKKAAAPAPMKAALSAEHILKSGQQRLEVMERL